MVFCQIARRKLGQASRTRGAFCVEIDGHRIVLCLGFCTGHLEKADRPGRILARDRELQFAASVVHIGTGRALNPRRDPAFGQGFRQSRAGDRSHSPRAQGTGNELPAIEPKRLRGNIGACQRIRPAMCHSQILSVAKEVTQKPFLSNTTHITASLGTGNILPACLCRDPAAQSGKRRMT